MNPCLGEASRFVVTASSQRPLWLRLTVCVHTLQVCTEVLEALREGHLGDDQQKAAEAYRVACHKIFPYSLSFLPPGYQDNTSAVSANGDMFTGEHNDLANEMWSLRTSSGALVHQPTRFPQSLGYGCCELPPHCTDLDGRMDGMSTGQTANRAGTRRRLHFFFKTVKKVLSTSVITRTDTYGMTEKRTRRKVDATIGWTAGQRKHGVGFLQRPCFHGRPPWTCIRFSPF